jgi:hypothetical protein
MDENEIQLTNFSANSQIPNFIKICYTASDMKHGVDLASSHMFILLISYKGHIKAIMPHSYIVEFS